VARQASLFVLHSLLFVFTVHFSFFTSVMAELSYPKEKIKIVLLEGIHPAAVAELARAGYTQVQSHAKALPAAELAATLADAHVVGIRSKTRLTAELLAQAPKLLAIGAFCIGTDQIALEAATLQGVAAFNSPYSSTRSVAELVLGACIALERRLFEKSTAVHAGQWPKTSTGAHEIRNKTLGIVGYGRIGSQVSVMAESLGMKVLYYDIEPKLSLGNARPASSLDEVLTQADIVTLHVPADPTTHNLMGAEQFARMKPGAVFINYARGKVVHLPALADAIRSGHVGGAAVDVFPEEPRSNTDPFSTPLQGLPNVILSPHIGGSTEEAQEAIGLDVAHKIIGFLDRGVSIGSVTLPELNLPRTKPNVHRLLHIHHNRPGVVSEINSRLAALGSNIVGQHLNTNAHIGYVVLDIEEGNTAAALDEIRHVRHTIRARSLY